MVGISEDDLLMDEVLEDYVLEDDVLEEDIAGVGSFGGRSF